MNSLLKYWPSVISLHSHKGCGHENTSFTSIIACILAGTIKLTIAVSSLTTEIFSKMILLFAQICLQP